MYHSTNRTFTRKYMYAHFAYVIYWQGFQVPIHKNDMTIFCCCQPISQRGILTSLEKQLGSNCFSRGFCTSISKGNYSHLWFSRGVEGVVRTPSPPLDLHMAFKHLSPYIWPNTSWNQHFEYGYLHSNAHLCLFTLKQSLFHLKSELP